MHRTYQKLYEKFYWDDYEEKVEGSDTLRYYYLNGANGLEALHIVKTSPNAQPVSQTTKVVTDHLGSITALIDESDYAYIARYDAWGNREIVIPYWFDLTAGLIDAPKQLQQLFQYNNPNNQRGILFPRPNSTPSMARKLFSISLICSKFFPAPPTSNRYFPEL